MSRTCAHCGEVFDGQGALVCPHCGADVDFTYAETPSEFTFDDPRMGAEDYARFLEKEGLADPSPKRRGAGCGAVLLLVLAAVLLGRGLVRGIQPCGATRCPPSAGTP